jgi:hypothetical protein
MNLRDSDPSWRRPVIAVVGAVLIIGIIAWLYFLWIGNTSDAKVNGADIIKAARNYTHDLISRRLPLPKSVSLNELVDRGFLQSTQIAAFHGLDASITLVATNSDPNYVLMRVHLPDGTDLVLLANGSMQEVKP